MIIDIHAHTSRHRLWGLHTQQADIGDLREQARRHGIAKIYLMATYFPLKQSGLHNYELLERIEGDDLFGCFGSLDLENDLEHGYGELRMLAEKGLIDGIKLYPGYQSVLISDQAFWLVYGLAQKFNLPVAIHMGELHHCCPPKERDQSKFRCGLSQCPLDERGVLAHPIQLKKVAGVFPKVNFIVSHLANPYFGDLRQLMSNFSNVYTDISGQFVSGTAEDTPQYRQDLINEIRQFIALDGGIERLMFATDFPIQSYQNTLELVKALELKPAEEKMLLCQNAERILPRRR